MSRLLYRCDNLAEIENTYKDLRDAGVEDAHLHVIAKHLEDHSLLLGELTNRSRDFH